jgi:hypothetical protein
MRHYLIFGPSGVGKTSFGNFLGGTGKYVHLDFDRYKEGKYGIGEEKLTSEWSLLCECQDPSALREILNDRASNKFGCIMTFASAFYFFGPALECLKCNKLSFHFSSNAIELLDGYDLHCVYLLGTAEQCTEAYINREIVCGERDRTSLRADWERFNRIPYERMTAKSLAKYRIDVFDAAGNRRSHESVADQMGISLRP